jgi:hypothetical protein
MTGISAGIVYSPRMKPMDSAILMHTKLFPQVDGRRQDLISITFAILSSHSCATSVSRMSGATILMLTVAVSSSFLLPSMLTNICKSCSVD